MAVFPIFPNPYLMRHFSSDPNSRANTIKEMANYGIFAVSGGLGFAGELILNNLLPASFNAIGRAFLVPAAGTGTATAIDLLASIGLTEKNSLAVYLVGLALGEISGVAAEYYLTPALTSAGLSPMQMALINASIAAGSTAFFNLIAKAKTCCSNNAQSDDEKLKLLV